MTSIAVRTTLPARRACETLELVHGSQNTVFKITIGRYPDGRIGEVFISGAKTGSDFEGVARDGAVLLSIALQFGVPLATIQHAITRNHDGTPTSIVGRVVELLAQNHDRR